jgi:hypothetical protein
MPLTWSSAGLAASQFRKHGVCSLCVLFFCAAYYYNDFAQKPKTGALPRLFNIARRPEEAVF